MRGPVYAALPATVREAAESNIYTDDARAFVEGLGARPEYAVCKRGNYYICHHQGLEIQARRGEGGGAAGVGAPQQHPRGSASGALRG